MKIINLKNLLAAAILLSIFSSCRKNNSDNPAPTTTVQRAGIYILNQGGFGSNNGSLSYYDYATKTVTADIFTKANNKGLGDTPNDLQIYGSKMYIAVDVSGTVEILNAKTAAELKQISFKSGNVNKEPRSFAFDKGNAFVTTYDGNVAVIDTFSMAVTKTIAVGRNPERMVVSNNKLYVTNSGGLSFGNPDKTVSVIDLNTLTVTKTITVIANPTGIAADGSGHVYVLSSGDYNTIKPGMTVIDNNTDAVISSNSTSIAYGSNLVANGDYVYILTSDKKVAQFNVKTQAFTNTSFIDASAVTTPYSLSYDSVNSEFFITDAKNYASNGALFAFDKTGAKEYNITVGINPGTVAFFNK
ncbi:YncE family protein [Mucilaginibacter ginkgonis]|uniref:YncE family protein n=1 Tax=Mucilaginibacter ginkgonis TaxID=2682091 RepID=A0A6I4HXE8_9SPHI|nr:DUF5074 domain-containing protein [Mucilaginibacter ginkgonis]QQL51433.1 YncE family protein [Mucilaginibacter ginkgonis]